MKFQPDLLVVQECEQESKYKKSQLISGYTDFLWFGDNPNKGLAVLSFNDYKVALAENYNQAFQYIVPILLSKGKNEIRVYIVWAMPHPKSSIKSYVGQIWDAINYYNEPAFSKESLWIGDWNSNAIWDNQRKASNHTSIVNKLEASGIVSLYHTLRKEPPGQEKEPTLYLLKNRDKPYHMDYCFAPRHCISDHTTVEVGKFEQWITLSDHMPLIIDGLTLPL